MAEHEDLELKPLSPEAVDRALEKATHYRALNDPQPAESICLDVLEARPDDQRAIVLLILSLTDQFASGRARVQEARRYVSRLEGEYEREYYAGIVYEKQARAFLRRGEARVFAYDMFRDAMDAYEKAEALRPAGNDDAILRWNCCVREIKRGRLGPAPKTSEIALE